MNLKEFKKAAKQFAKTHTVCSRCLGVGCMPENFGIGNSGKPCYKCKGKGSIKKNETRRNRKSLGKGQ